MKNTIFIIGIIIGLTSCNKDFTEDEVKLEIENPGGYKGSSFLFNTTGESEVIIEFFDNQTQPVDGVYVELYYENPFITSEDGGEILNKEIKPVFKGMSNSDGKLSTNLSIPKSISKLYVRPFSPGFISMKELVVNAGEISTVFGNEEVDSSYSSTAEKKAALSYLTLGEWNSVGYPHYKEKNKDKFDMDFVDDVNASLPESKSLQDSHPDYFEDGLVSEIEITEDAEVFVTFVHEGAGWMNTLGYYHYPTDNPYPKDGIRNKIIAFPNVSMAGSGGALQPGMKIQLKYYDEESGEFNSVFPAGTTISWFLNAQGWKGYITTGNYTLYGKDDFNVFIDEGVRKHAVVLHDSKRELFLIGFEDWRRDDPHSDQDFNDAVFYATSNPVTAINTKNHAPVDTPDDADDDGVSDVFDDFPNNPDLAYKNTYPAEGYGTLAFEDLWPYKGDYDFNDLVVDYQFDHLADAENRIKHIEGRLVTRAVGAGFHNGFGFQLDALTSDVKQVNGYKLFKDFVQLNSNGTESGHSRATMIAFDNAWGLFGYPGVNDFINTTPDSPHHGNDSITLSIELFAGLTIEEVGIPPYNPFIFVNMDRTHEVHLPGYRPTELADQSLFGTGHDTSNPLLEEYYVCKGNLPWALNIPVSFDYPEEKVNIEKIFFNFKDWSDSNGSSYPDWYLDKQGYRNNELIYSITE